MCFVKRDNIHLLLASSEMGYLFIDSVWFFSSGNKHELISEIVSSPRYFPFFCDVANVANGT